MEKFLRLDRGLFVKPEAIIKVQFGDEKPEITSAIVFLAGIPDGLTVNDWTAVQDLRKLVDFSDPQRQRGREVVPKQIGS